MTRPLLFILCALSVFLVYGQSYNLTENTKVSVLTFGPGNSLNDAFGHNAFRIKDNTIGLDLVYGYGEYDFDAPNFYLKFAQGKLNYLLSKHKFKDIYYHYSSHNRSISEQILNLNIEEKKRLYNYLENNYKLENRKYLYDFFYDNCATKIRDVTNTATLNQINFRLPETLVQKTFRELIYEHVDKNTWGSFGIDLALGSIIDRNAQPKEYMFLPKYINGFFKVATVNSSKKLIADSSELYQNRPDTTNNNFFLSPVFVLGLLSLFIIYITYKDYKLKRRSKWIDVVLFSITGVVGILLTLLWFATDHSATGYNYNLLWAFPFNLILIVQLTKTNPKNWTKGYLKFLILMLVLMTMHWLIGVQIFAIGLIPFLIAIILRYIFLIRVLNTNYRPR